MNGDATLRVMLLVQRRQRRGAEVFAHALGDALEARGHRVATVYLYHPPARTALPPRPRDVELGGRPSHPLERVPGFHPGLLAELRRTILRFAPDVVQVNGSRTVKYGALARRLDRREGWPLVYRNIGNPDDWLGGPLHRRLYRLLVAPAVDGVVGVSRTTLDGVRRHYRLRVPMEAIPRGVDPAALAPQRPRGEIRAELGTPEDAPVVSFVGHLSREKRPDRLLRVAAALRREVPELMLWLVGDGPLRREVETRAAAPDLAGAVRVLGRRGDVGTLLHAADLLLLTSDTEGMPGVVLEAACSGVPAVATRVGGTAEAVVHGETGLLAPADDEAALTAAALHLLRHPEERRAMGRQARRRFDERFTISRVACRYEIFYRRVLSTTGSGEERA